MKKSKVLLCAASLVLAGGMIVSAFMIWRQLNGEKQDGESFDSLRQEAVQSTVEQTPPPEGDSEPAAIHKRDISGLTERNQDTAGWIYIEDTMVDYPVMHTPNEPQRYLHTSFEGKKSFSGVPFMDARCSRDSDNIIIYGHNMKSGTMFADTVNYLEKDYLDAHPVIEWETVYGCRYYHVFAVARIDMADKWYGFFSADNAAAFDEMIDHILEAAEYGTGARPKFGQQLITLSTCYGSGDDGRLVIVAAEAE